MAATDVGVLPQLAAQLRMFWQDAGVQETFRLRNHFQLTDSTDYYFDKIEAVRAIAAPNASLAVDPAAAALPASWQRDMQRGRARRSGGKGTCPTSRMCSTRACAQPVSRACSLAARTGRTGVRMGAACCRCLPTLCPC